MEADKASREKTFLTWVVKMWKNIFFYIELKKNGDKKLTGYIHDDSKIIVKLTHPCTGREGMIL